MTDRSTAAPAAAIPASVTPIQFPAPPATAEQLAAVSLLQWRAVLAGEPRAAAQWMEAAARLGQAEAQAVLGQWLLDGRGVARDAQQALYWFLHAAQQGHAMGMNMAGRCHEQGWGTAVDLDKAAHWYRRAVATGQPEARYNLANLLATGHGVPQDHAEAFALYRAAAEQGYAKASTKLARYYEDGLVVPADPEHAFALYRRGAEGGDFRGQFNYAGLLAARGRRDEALQWLAQVPETATPRYLREAGAALLQSPDAEIRAIGQGMLDKAGLPSGV